MTVTLFLNACRRGNDAEIVFITDQKYYPVLQTALYSLVKNKSPASRYTVHIVTMGLSDEQNEELSLFAQDGVQINVLRKEMPPLPFRESNHHVSRASLAKFFLPEYFSDKDKILYLDADILVAKDLSALYAADLENKILGAVHLFSFYDGEDHIRKFNAGVLLMNLKKMRQEGLPEKLYKWRTEHNTPYSMDELAFNTVVADDFVTLPYTFNTMTHVFSDVFIDDMISTLQKEYGDVPQNLSVIYQNAHIIHYISPAFMEPKLWLQPEPPADEAFKYALWHKWYDTRDEAKRFLELKRLQKAFVGHKRK